MIPSQVPGTLRFPPLSVVLLAIHQNSESYGLTTLASTPSDFLSSRRFENPDYDISAQDSFARK